jgi:Mrp family chromosome partitioning ATPase
LLGSKRFREFLTTLSEHFEWVVVDTPPVMAVTDPCVASHVMSSVVFVVGAEMTSWHTARRALEQLAVAKANVAGAILNRVDLKHHPYYYSQYYHRAYGEYYAAART